MTAAGYSSNRTNLVEARSQDCVISLRRKTRVPMEALPRISFGKGGA
jgi:hypothetical protein